MAELIAVAFSHRGLIVAFALSGLWLGFRPGSRTARRLLILVTVAYTLGSMYVIPYSLSRLLVAGYRPLSAQDIPSGRIAIVLLEGRSDFVLNWSGRAYAYPDRLNAVRIWETYRVHRLVPDALIICSEGSSAIPNDAQPARAVKPDALGHLGVEASQIVTEIGAHNTRDEAIRIAPKVKSLAIDHVILVTSDTHMRRSLAAFREAGLEAIPAIARDPEESKSWKNWLLPNARALDLTHEVVHETLGLIYYGARGWLRF
jgi:uncharacterized SAM-binding protein YcdF (DUF218 family)